MYKIILFILIFALFLPFSASAFLDGPIVHCGTRDPDSKECTLCDIFIMLKNIIEFLMELIIVIAPIFVLAGGVMILTAGVKPDQVATGKKMITSALVGIVIALASWIVLGTLFNFLAKGPSDSGDGMPWAWNKVKCEGGGVIPGEGEEAKMCTCGANAPEGSHLFNTASECSDQCESYCDTKYSVTVGCCGTDVKLSGCEGALPTGKWRFQGDLGGTSDQQRADASSALTNFLDCFYSKAPSDIGYISAITDKDIYNGTCDPQDCKTDVCTTSVCGAGNSCDHACYSCHYGGRCSTTKSYAVDFGDETTVCYIAEYAAECFGVNKIYGPSFYVDKCPGLFTADGNHENHVHISVINSCNCN
ncbi:pilin [Patescibacteria group bacterium]|nr:pilin [Patescibacteria group bacterium]